MKSSTLYCQDGKSDKVYTASLDGGVVQFAWGRRGGTMQTKTVGPLAPGAAELLWSSKLDEKRKGGYLDGEDATPLMTAGFDPLTSVAANAAPAAIGQSGHDGPTDRKLKLVPKPMLLREITRAEMLALAPLPEWLFQEKHDGDRILLVKSGAALTSYSRSGRETHSLPRPIVKAAMACPSDFILDGEIIGDTVWTWDALEYDGDLRHLPYSERRRAVERMVETFSGNGIRMVKTAGTPEEKLALVADVLQRGGEGIAMKLDTAPYQPGRTNYALKFKFVATASVIVASHNIQSSFNMKLFDGTDLGRCTVAGKPRPPVSSVVEVRYLNVSRGGSLYQPVYLGIRKDIDPSECVIDQLEFKGEAR